MSESTERHAERGAVGVLLPRPLPDVLDYLPPNDSPDLCVGDYVRVPLRGRQEVGVVWGPARGDVPLRRLRPVSLRLDIPSMQAETREFIRRAAAYTLTPLGSMLALSFRPRWLLAGASTVQVVRRTGAEPTRLTPTRRAVLEALDAHGAETMPVRALAAAAGVSGAVIRGLVTAGVLTIETARAADPECGPIGTAATAVELTAGQRTAAEALRAAYQAQEFSSTLLQGVTGSGKTEVYLEAVAECVAQGQQALVLLPEIALTETFVQRLRLRLAMQPTVWHSLVSPAARRRAWWSIAEGASQIVVGARSALFLPYRKLGLIVVDEEHDGSYKQDEGVIYHARDLAVLRASTAKIAAVLTTATPSLETYANVQWGRYQHLLLPERIGQAELPEVEIVDIRASRPEARSWMTPPLVAAVAESIAGGQQALLFLNRRGYAPLTICRNCGHQLYCPNCDSLLVEHRGSQVLTCHQCTYTQERPQLCPECNTEDTLAPCGPGVERLAEEAERRFPGARIVALSSDLTGDAVELQRELGAVERGEVDIIVGTQIIAKGHHFPGINLVGVIDTDFCLKNGGDLRAGERTFQVVRQVTGRAGRGGGKSRALLQTVDPDHEVIQAIKAGDEVAFLELLMRKRKEANVPPYSRYVGIIVSSEDEGTARTVAHKLAKQGRLLVEAGVELMGPAPAIFKRLRGRWRWRLLAKAPRDVRMQPAIRRWRDSVTVPPEVKVTLDVDPLSFV